MILTIRREYTNGFRLQGKCFTELIKICEKSKIHDIAANKRETSHNRDATHICRFILLFYFFVHPTEREEKEERGTDKFLRRNVQFDGKRQDKERRGTPPRADGIV